MKRTQTMRTLVAASLLALFAALLAPVASAGAAQGPPGAPGAITGAWNTATDTKLDLSWTSPGGTYLEYDVQYRTDSGTVWSASTSCPATGWTSGSTGVRALTASITGLTKTDTYVVAVRARDRETGLYGAWACSGLIEPAGTPAVVWAISEAGRTSAVSSLTLSWDKVSGAAGGYDVRVSEDRATKSWATTLAVAQPATGDTVTPRLTSTNLPSGFSIAKTYVVQVRSKSATGTCGSGTVLCSRWVQSEPLAQLDIFGLEVERVVPASVPNYVENIGYHVQATWDALPAAVSSPTYKVRMNYRSGDPNDHYDSSDTNSSAHSIPNSWHQDWNWHYLCETHSGSVPSSVNSDLSSRGCAQPCADDWNITCNRSNAYGDYEPLWRFDQGIPIWGDWVDVASTTCSTATSTCSHTFNFAADQYQTVTVQVHAVSGSTTGPTTTYRSSSSSPPKAPRNIRVCAPTGASVRVEWQRGFRGSAPITGYDLDLRKKATSLLDGSTTTVSGTLGTAVTDDDVRRCDQTSSPSPYTGNHPSDPVLSYTWRGVDTNRSYDVLINGVNRYGRGAAAASSTIALTPTYPATPAPPTVTTRFVSTAVRAAVTWEAPADDGGSPVTSYTLTYRNCTANCGDGQTPTWGSWTALMDLTGTSRNVAPLLASTKYEFGLLAKNSVGVSFWSESTFVTTASAPG